MWRYLTVCSLLLASCQTTRYYIVRHGEKAAPGASMSSDVPLSEAGEQRARDLRGRLLGNHIQYVYSTNYQRTKATARPTAEAIGAGIETYDPKDTSFVARVLARGKGNALIVGHSNTVDDLVNRFMGQQLLQDLPDTAYNNLFIITRKGKKLSFARERYGK
ncbi:SixA phosphatase family protein [Flaviaesturariibacter flavus]|nr:histidine phosphatase family protein [Flaviaesturariibacter flavus]